jgi:hypothetical protein
MIKRGFSYTLEDEKITEYMKLSAGQKLEWLEAINELTRLALTPAEKEMREKFRAGEI